MAQKRASAPPRGEVKGISHKTSEAKRLREDAKKAEKLFKEAKAKNDYGGWTIAKWNQ